MPESLIPAEEVANLPEKEYPSETGQKIDDSFLKDVPEDVIEEKEEAPKPRVKREDDEERVPARRFEKVYGERKEWERRAIESEERVKRLEDMMEKSLTASQQKQIERTTPDKWKEILGRDNPLTDKFYELLDEEMTAREERAAAKALEQWESRQAQESEFVSERIETLEEEHEEFADSIGIDPSTPEGDDTLAKILEIQDRETPVGRDGKYSQPLIPLSVAYKLYQAETRTVSNGQRQNRNRASAIVASGRADAEAPRAVPKGRPDPSGWRKFIGG